MPAKRLTAVTVFIAVLVVTALGYYLAWRMEQPGWLLTMIACVGGPAAGYLGGRIARGRTSGES